MASLIVFNTTCRSSPASVSRGGRTVSVPTPAFRAGMLVSAFTKLKYTDHDETLKIKTRRDWNLNKYRYGIYGKIGTGNFNIFWYQNLFTLFKTGKGPDEHDINSATFGISLCGF